MGYPDTATGFMHVDAKNWTKFEKQEIEHRANFSVVKFPLKPFEDSDIDVAIDCCGVCGSDVHKISGGWGDHHIPLCVGHEIIGRAVKVGPSVSWCKVGDRVGVGAQIAADLTCKNCKAGEENYCPNGVDTYDSAYPDGTISQGGYSSHVRAHQQFVFPIPEKLSSEDAAPMMCAGLTVFSPLKRLGCGPGKHVAVVGIGGLGHYAVLFAAAMGAEVTAISHSPSKKDDAYKLGAKNFISQKDDPKWFEKYPFEFDYIINTAKAVDTFNLKMFLSTLKVMGKFHNVGMPEHALPELHFQDFAGNGSYIGTSHIGNRTEMLEMLQLAAEKGVKSWVQEVEISPEGCKEVVERVYNNENVRYRLCLTNYDKAFGKRY
ncbi:GroES-like protein [Rhizodiscina lignyota]|uniref:alcohol dehydrogenase (NADP(+)) n=1 Tax=Rhizodiscina lignyota TaxID=1504668 RepID=A0A9P4IBU1_9PEZI|nr:GroES-like protein [Rhizodiscina lignyota]